ncbi:hypothetical protein H4R35_002655 [Dimargaris xerosporica]|nr:hypothetical protein H4R35_002655 [Dimargaris xerosporica]
MLLPRVALCTLLGATGALAALDAQAGRSYDFLDTYNFIDLYPRQGQPPPPEPSFNVTSAAEPTPVPTTGPVSVKQFLQKLENDPNAPAITTSDTPAPSGSIESSPLNNSSGQQTSLLQKNVKDNGDLNLLAQSSTSATASANPTTNQPLGQTPNQKQHNLAQADDLEPSAAVPSPSPTPTQVNTGTELGNSRKPHQLAVVPNRDDELMLDISIESTSTAPTSIQSNQPSGINNSQNPRPQAVVPNSEETTTSTAPPSAETSKPSLKDDIASFFDKNKNDAKPTISSPTSLDPEATTSATSTQDSNEGKHPPGTGQIPPRTTESDDPSDSPSAANSLPPATQITSGIPEATTTKLPGPPWLSRPATGETETSSDSLSLTTSDPLPSPTTSDSLPPQNSNPPIQSTSDPLPPQSSNQPPSPTTSDVLPPQSSNQPPQSTSDVSPPQSSNQPPPQSTSDVVPPQSSNQLPSPTTSDPLPPQNSNSPPSQITSDVLPPQSSNQPPPQSTSDVVPPQSSNQPPPQTTSDDLPPNTLTSLDPAPSDPRQSQTGSDVAPPSSTGNEVTNPTKTVSEQPHSENPTPSVTPASSPTTEVAGPAFTDTNTADDAMTFLPSSIDESILFATPTGSEEPLPTNVPQIIVGNADLPDSIHFRITLEGVSFKMLLQNNDISYQLIRDYPSEFCNGIQLGDSSRVVILNLYPASAFARSSSRNSGDDRRVVFQMAIAPDKRLGDYEKEFKDTLTRFINLFTNSRSSFYQTGTINPRMDYRSLVFESPIDLTSSNDPTAPNSPASPSSPGTNKNLGIGLGVSLGALAYIVGFAAYVRYRRKKRLEQLQQNFETI